MLTCCLCACSKALMKLNEAEALRNSMEKTATALDCFEEATFFSLKGEVKRQGDAEGCPGGWSRMLSLLAGGVPAIASPWYISAASAGGEAWESGPCPPVSLFLCRSAVI